MYPQKEQFGDAHNDNIIIKTNQQTKFDPLKDPFSGNSDSETENDSSSQNNKGKTNNTKDNKQINSFDPQSINPFSDDEELEEEEYYDEEELTKMNETIDKQSIGGHSGIMVGVGLNNKKDTDKAKSNQIVRNQKIIINKKAKDLNEKKNILMSTQSDSITSSSSDSDMSSIEDLIVKPKMKKAKENNIRVMNKIISKAKDKKKDNIE